MDEIFTLLNNYINLCSKCPEGLKEHCSWFQIVSNPFCDRGNLSTEKYKELSYEEIASYYEKDAGRPYCDNQLIFDELMIQARSILRCSNVPTETEELIQLLTDIVQMEKRISRLSSECTEAFSNPILAVMEVSLAHIDYFYLKNGLDIYSLIASVHGDYHRDRVLKGTYVSRVVDLYIQKARKLSVEEIVDYPGNLLHLAPIPSFFDLDKKEVEKESGKEKEATISDYVADASAPLQSLTKMLTSQEVCDFVAAVSMFLGVRPSNYVEPLANYKKRGFIESNLKFKQYYVFPYRKELYEEIAEEVRLRKDNEQELAIYISGILSPFQYIVPLLHPGDRDIHSAQLEVAFGVSYQFGEYSIQRFAEVFNKAIEDVGNRAEIEPEQRLSELHNTLLNKYYDKEEASEDGILVSISDLRNLLDILQGAIEGALLTNGITHDVRYYQKLTGINFVSGVLDTSLSIMTGHSIEFIKNLAKKLNHAIFFATKENESMDSYMMRMLYKKEEPVLEENVPDEEIKPVGKPKLMRGIRYADIPLSDVEEIDALENYFDDAKVYHRYYYHDAEESFGKKCKSIAQDKTLSIDEKEIWISKVLNTLDSAFCIADKDNPDVQQMAVGYYSVMEFAFLGVAEPVCIKKLCFQLDTTVILREVIPLGEKERPEDFNVYDYSYPENIYTEVMMENVGGNIVHYEKRLCKNCPLVKCPYRNLHSKDGVYLPEDYPQDLLEPLGIVAEGRNEYFEALPEELKTQKAIQIWNKAMKAELVDEQYVFHGSRRQLALFSYLFSQALFNENRWTVFIDWCGYSHLCKTYGDVEELAHDKISEPLKKVYKLFGYE